VVIRVAIARASFGDNRKRRLPDYEIGRREAALGDEFKDDRAHLGGSGSSSHM
jgi:hypothetical protein